MVSIEGIGSEQGGYGRATAHCQAWQRRRPAAQNDSLAVRRRPLTSPARLSIRSWPQADEAKMKDLSLQLEKMLAAVQKKRAELEDEVTETQAAQIELDKTAEDFRKLHKERGDLVAQVRASPVAVEQTAGGGGRRGGGDWGWGGVHARLAEHRSVCQLCLLATLATSHPGAMGCHSSRPMCGGMQLFMRRDASVDGLAHARTMCGLCGRVFVVRAHGASSLCAITVCARGWQWEAAVGAMQKRDEAIQKAHEDFLVAKRQLREKQEVLTEREAFLARCEIRVAAVVFVCMSARRGSTLVPMPDAALT